MPVSIRFQQIRLGTEGEDAWLGVADEHVLTVLVRIDGEEIPAADRGWFLQTGFGPCDQEGVFFPSLGAAESWMRDRVLANGLPAAAQGEHKPE